MVVGTLFVVRQHENVIAPLLTFVTDNFINNLYNNWELCDYKKVADRRAI